MSRCCKASHTFNLLDARRAISVTERQRYILRVRTLARGVAQAYLRQPRGLGFPLLAAIAQSGGSGGPHERDRTHRAARFSVRDRHRGVAAQGPADARTGASRPACAPSSPRRTCATARWNPSRPRAGSRCASGASPARSPNRSCSVAARPCARPSTRRASPRARRWPSPTAAALHWRARSRARRARAMNISGSQARGRRARAVSLLPGIVQRGAGGAADTEAHALGRGQRAVRAPGALAGDAVRRGSGAGDDARIPAPVARPAVIAFMRRGRCAARAGQLRAERC